MAEYVAAEVAERYLTADQLAGRDPPFLWVAHYERDAGARRAGLEESWSLVTFRHYRRERTPVNAAPPGWRYRIGEPHWDYLSRQDFEDLVGRYTP